MTREDAVHYAAAASGDPAVVDCVAFEQALREYGYAIVPIELELPVLSVFEDVSA